MYTPQRLFGEVGSSPDVLTHEPFLERARLQREQEQEGSARLALGAYIVARLIDRLLTLDGDEGRQGFRWQLEAVRRHVNELPSDASETSYLAGVVSSISDGERPSPSLGKNLTAYAYFLEHEGRLEEALEMAALAARSSGTALPAADFVQFGLLGGRLNRLLARWERANACYSAAEDSACATGNLNAALRARLGRANTLRGQGNLPRARIEVEQIISEASGANLTDVLSDAYQDLGVVLMLQGSRTESLEATYTAFRLCEDAANRMRILTNLGYALNESGYYGAARVALEIVVDSDASHHVQLNALLELMQLESAVGNRVAFERRRQQVRSSANRMAPSTAVDYRYKTAIGLARFGQLERAREVASDALNLAEKHRLNEWYFRLERMLKGLETDPASTPDLEAPAEASITPAVHRVAAGLQEYASVAAG